MDTNDCLVDTCERCDDLVGYPYCIETLCRDCMLELMDITEEQLDRYLADKYPEDENE